MAHLSISTYLEAPPETIKAHALTPRLLHYVAKGMIRFDPVDPPAFPDVWVDGEYKANMLWKGFLLIGWQIIGIEIPPRENQAEIIRDNGRGAMIQVWDHMIEVRPEGTGCRYTDRLELKAGLLTPFIWLFAQIFYRHRQKRWRHLVKTNFDYTT